MADEPHVRRIATEEAFAIPEQFDGYRALGRSTWSSPDVVFWSRTLGNPDTRLVDALLDLDDMRIADMDAHGVDVQLLLLTSPGVQIFDADTATEMAELANDRLAEAIARHPDRLAGLGAFAPQDPRRAAREMERAIGELGLNGFVVNSHTDGEYLDQEKFWPILEAAEALDAPIYIHPRPLPQSAIGPYLEHELWAGIWGYAAETGLHGLRLITSGVLDRFPRLTIVLGHMGEGLPFSIWRVDYHNAWVRFPQPYPAKRKIGEYFSQNFHITTSGNFRTQSLIDAMLEIGADRILFSTDWPFENIDHAADWFDAASISEGDRMKIGRTNAIRLFKLELKE
jgi:predicted TIM-barrel fold metal-dependent hydrolase